MNYETLPQSSELIEDKPKTVEEHLGDYLSRQEKEKTIVKAQLLKFEGLKLEQTVGGVSRPIRTREKDSVAAQIDTYNPSKVFYVEGKLVTAMRVEARGSEKDSLVEFFELDEKTKGHLIEEAPILENHQDPFYMGEIQGEKIFGAVKIYERDDKTLGYKTEFYKFKEKLNELHQFAEGPDMEKDIRLIDLQNGKIGVFTRPQGGERYDRGKIGYLEIDSLNRLEEALKDIERAKIFDNLFAPEEWGGVNDLHLLKNGKIGVIGHIAHFKKNEGGQETDQKEYFATAAIFDPQTQEFSNLKIIMRKEDIETSLHLMIEPKNKTLKSILIPGGSIRKEDGTMEFYAGVGDTEAVVFSIPDPFLKYEVEGEFQAH